MIISEIVNRMGRTPLPRQRPHRALCYSLATVDPQWLKVMVGRKHPPLFSVAFLLLVAIAVSYVFGCSPTVADHQPRAASVTVSGHEHAGHHDEHAGCPTAPDAAAALRLPQLRDLSRDVLPGGGLVTAMAVLLLAALSLAAISSAARRSSALAAERRRWTGRILLHRIAVLRT